MGITYQYSYQLNGSRLALDIKGTTHLQGKGMTKAPLICKVNKARQRHHSSARLTRHHSSARLTRYDKGTSHLQG